MEIDPFVSSSIDTLLKGMQGLLQRGEEVVPQIFLFAHQDGGYAICPLIGVEKPVGEELERMLRTGQRDAPFTPKPGMDEALVVQISLADGDWTYQWPYVRGEKEIVFTAEPQKANPERCLWACGHYKH